MKNTEIKQASPIEQVNQGEKDNNETGESKFSWGLVISLASLAVVLFVIFSLTGLFFYLKYRSVMADREKINGGDSQNQSQLYGYNNESNSFYDNGTTGEDYNAENEGQSSPPDQTGLNGENEFAEDNIPTGNNQDQENDPGNQNADNIQASQSWEDLEIYISQLNTQINGSDASRFDPSIINDENLGLDL